MTLRHLLIPVGMVLALASGPVVAQADNGATVGRVQGDVLVNQGQRFTPISPGGELAPSDIILTGADSSIELVFGDGSSLVLPSGIQSSVGDIQACMASEPLDEPITLANPSGTVITMPVDGDGEAIPAARGQAVGPGQRVIAGAGSAIDVIYPSGCTVRLGANEFLDLRFAQECCVPGGAQVASTAALGADAVAMMRGVGLSTAEIAIIVGTAATAAAIISTRGEGGAVLRPLSPE